MQEAPTKTIVVPETLVPVSVQKDLAPPIMPSAAEIYKSALSIANKALPALKYASKAEIKSASDYKDVLDAAKELRARMNELEADRKRFTDPGENWKRDVIAAYASPKDILSQGYDHLQKLGVTWNKKVEEEQRQEKLRLLREQEERNRKAEADRKAREAAERMKQAEEEAYLENLQMMAEATAEEEGAGTAAHVIDDAEVRAKEAEIERERAERDRKRKEEEAAEEERLERERREAANRMQTLKHTKPKGVKDSWDYEIENPAAVVRQLCSPDEKKIRAANKAGLLVDEEGKPTALAAGLRMFETSKLTGRGGGSR